MIATQVVTVAPENPVVKFWARVGDSSTLAGEAAFADELIDLRTSLDDGTLEYAEYEEQRARLLGF